MPSRVPQMMEIDSPLSRTDSSSVRRSARRARLATFTMARGLRTRLGNRSSATTGNTRVAWRSGHTSPGKCSPQSHSGRSVMLRSVFPLRHDEPPMEFTSTRLRTRARWSCANRTATPPPNECPTTTAGSSMSSATSRSATHWA